MLNKLKTALLGSLVSYFVADIRETTCLKFEAYWG